MPNAVSLYGTWFGPMKIDLTRQWQVYQGGTELVYVWLDGKLLVLLPCLRIYYVDLVPQVYKLVLFK